MSDLFDTLVVQRKANLDILDILSDTFVDAVNLHTSQLVTAATSNNFNRGFTGIAPSKAFAKSLKNADFQINRSTSNDTRAKIEKKRQETTQKPGILIHSQEEVHEHEHGGEVESDGEISHQPYYRLKYRVREAITSYLNPLKASDATVDIVQGQY